MTIRSNYHELYDKLNVMNYNDN